ncbi:MAG: AmmeMemoRadiSam system protein B [Acidobacteria bacterium]|nr:AmmeMemoRadiSam system protein B [Acidobacteriota bacterium]MCI0660102.1 AmmeMemoRadiSam system protein B [Acidobacteriota bacterium]
MDKQLPRLRLGLDIIPSPLPDKPGVLFRDPFRYTEEMLIIPPLLAAGLVFFDGESTVLDVQAYLSKLAGQIIPSEIIQSLVDALKHNGFLESEEFDRMRVERHAEFEVAPSRLPAHSGTGYPDDVNELRSKLDEYLQNNSTPAANPIIGLAAPHVSPWGGWQCYAAAYGRLSGEARQHAANKTIVVLGTSHYGEPEKFGLTLKPFVTPLGTLQPDTDLINRLVNQAGFSVTMEDYCHAVEHSIEFQCVFLQQMLGSEFKIVPILCGPFAKALQAGERPENDDKVMRFFEALGEMAELHAGNLFWVLGIDLAHIGRRYGDETIARAERGVMLEVKEQDKERLDRVCEGNSEEFFELVRPEQDRLKWCGFSPLYTFLSAVPGARGQVIRYDQWNIDEQSAVSFAAMEFV